MRHTEEGQNGDGLQGIREYTNTEIRKYGNMEIWKYSQVPIVQVHLDTFAASSRCRFNAWCAVAHTYDQCDRLGSMLISTLDEYTSGWLQQVGNR